MVGVYLAAYTARHYNYDIIYNDIVSLPGINLVCDMLDVDLSSYDFIIASPPCNYYSRCNYRRDISSYALKTKHLLPDILIKCCKQNKPFIIENVRNDTIMKAVGIFDIVNKYSNCFIYYVGRHIYFTNIMINLYCKQIFDFNIHGRRLHKGSQGGVNVYNVIEIFLNYIHTI